MDSYMEAIESYILDEKQVVTYKWLSKKLLIHNSVAKKALAEYIEDPTRKEKCSVTYSVIGKTASGLSVIVVTESEFLDIKDSFVDVFSHHIYSLQERKEKVDLNVLYDADKLVDIVAEKDLRSVRYCNDNLIKCEQLRHEKTGENDKVSTLSNATVEKSIEHDSSSMQQNTRDKNTTGYPAVKENVSALEKKTGLFSMWNKQKNRSNPKADKTSEIIQNGDATKEDVTDRGKSRVPESTSEGTNSPESESVPSSSSKSNVVATFNKEKPKVDSTKTARNNKIAVEHVSSPNNCENGNISLKLKEKSKRKISDKKSEKVPHKKMKRIVVLTDSESEEENRSDEEILPDLEMKPEDEENNVANAEVSNAHSNKRKIRKVLDKTGIGEDGFFYTKKEIVYESCDEEEIDENEKSIEKVDIKKIESDLSASKEANKQVKQQVKSKNKQSSIMNFFGAKTTNKK